MSNLNEQQIKALFDKIIEPELKWSINSLGLLKKLEIQQDIVNIEINLVTEQDKLIDEFKTSVIEAIKALGASEVKLNIGHVNVGAQGVEGVKNIILVGAGKGGVGKTSVAVNIATALAKAGYSTGIMDADLYGPSIPRVLGNMKARPEVLAHENIMPIEHHNIKAMSVGYLVDTDTSIDWRGQMTSGTVLQFIQNTNWGNLDYLIVDLPPGTGDIALTITHKLKCDGIILVSTPTKIALDDVRRSVKFFEERKVPILGIVENMSYINCYYCGEQNSLFNKSKTTIPSEVLGCKCIAKLPFSLEFATTQDEGVPYVIDHNDEITQEFKSIVDFISSAFDKENTQKKYQANN